MRASTSAERAARLLRWYPRAWRSRYGEEFAELLVADIEERPRSASRTADVIRGGIVARLGQAGLCGGAPEPGPPADTHRGPADRTGASLAALGCCAAVFAAVGGAMWSQLTTGWQWSPPGTAAVTVAMLAMSAAMLALFALAVLAVLPVAWRVAAARAKGMRGPSALFLAGLAVLLVGGRHFGNGWPGTGGHPWAHQGLVPGGVAAFSWASTLSVSSFWAHPAALAAFPAAELAWMALSPLAVAATVTGAAAVVRRAGQAPDVLSPRLLRFETWLGRAACAAMAVFFAGACAWVAPLLGVGGAGFLGAGSIGAGGAGSLFRPGAIDVAGLVVLILALAVARQAAGQARVGAR
jgi:hypothetical protein